MTILVTGAAGFIGMHVCKKLLERGDVVVGLDNINSYYDPKLKHARLAQLEGFKNFTFAKADLSDKVAVDTLFKIHHFDVVINLAAQAGVRYSLENPDVYVQSNIVGFLNILEACRFGGVKHLIYASSSSVYGANKKLPYSVDDKTDSPVSLYAATKKSNELMAFAYTQLYGFAATGLRFFTVYGPWGRPDMSPWLFSDAILQNKSINVFNYGDMSRDFTYIDDIVHGVVGVVGIKKSSGHIVYNIGNNKPTALLEFIKTLEAELGCKAIMNLMPMQKGDVYSTYADISELQKLTGFSPSTSLSDGLGRWVEWFKPWRANSSL
jgi:UDP-glucuronate 4-epimerase